MITRHARKNRSTVIRALRAANVATEKVPGAKGLRIREEEANEFLARQWPAVGPISSAAQVPGGERR